MGFVSFHKGSKLGVLQLDLGCVRDLLWREDDQSGLLAKNPPQVRGYSGTGFLEAHYLSYGAWLLRFTDEETKAQRGPCLGLPWEQR